MTSFHLPSFPTPSVIANAQAEELQLSGLVETLTRKNRHLQKELSEAHRSNEDMFEQRMRLQTAQVRAGGCLREACADGGHEYSSTEE